MTNAEQRLIEEIKATSSGVLYFTTVYYNIDFSYKTNKRRTVAMYSLEKAGVLEIVKDYWHGKTVSETGTLTTYTYGVKLAEPKVDEERSEKVKSAMKSGRIL